jgi:hypothetical protein
MLKTVVGCIQLALAIAGLVALYYHWDTVSAYVRTHSFGLTAGLHLVVGAGCFLAAGRAVVRQAAFVRRANRAVATVVRVTSSPDSESDHFSWYSPVLSFRPDGGEEVTFRAVLPTTNESRWKPGMTLPILYDPTNPRKVLVDDWLKWRDANLPVFFGVAATGIGLTMLWLGDWDHS